MIWRRAFIVTALAMTYALSVFAQDVNIDVNGTNRPSDGETTNVNSTITGAKFIVQATDTVINSDGMIVEIESGGAIEVGNDGHFINAGAIDIQAGGSIIVNDNLAYFDNMTTGLIDVAGAIAISNNGEFSNEGTNASGGGLNFSAGSTLSIETGGILNNLRDMIFAEGATYTNDGSGSFSNYGNLLVETGANNARDLIEEVTLLGTATLEITGASDNISNTINNTSDLGGTVIVIINTDDGNAYTSVNVGLSTLEIQSTTTFSGAVDAGDILVGQGTSTFQNIVKNNDATPGDNAFTVVNGAIADFKGTSADLQAEMVIVAAGGTLTFQDGGSMSATGTVDNSGVITFYEVSNYVSSGLISNQAGGVINYHSAMTGLAGAFGNTALLSDSELHLTGIADVTAALTLNAGTQAASTVYIDEGLTFTNTAPLNVGNATLVINGGRETNFNAAVAAVGIIVNESVHTTFNSTVDADLNVISKATFASGAIFQDHNITIGADGLLTNNSNNVKISAGHDLKNSGEFVNTANFLVEGLVTNYLGASINNTGTYENDGHLENTGTFTNSQIGTYKGTGALVNNGEFINSGTFSNETTTPGEITNNGTMTFNSTTRYNPSTGFGSPIHNLGTVNASAQIDDIHLRNLISDMALRGASTFNLTATANASLSGLFEFKETATGATVNFTAGSYTITLGNNTTFDAGNAALNLATGTVALSDNSVLSTLDDFTAAAKTTVDFSKVEGKTSTINAKNVLFETESSLLVGKDNTLNIVTSDGVGGIGVMTMKDKTTLDIADGGRIILTGHSSFESGSTVTLGDQSVLETTGDITFLSNTTINITATEDYISRIVTTGGNIEVAADKTTEVLFSGTLSEIKGKVFLLSETGEVVNWNQLYNPLYQFGLDTSSGGQGVYVSGLRSFLDSMADKFGGYDELSINKENGGKYTDETLLTEWGANNQDLLDYLQEAVKDTLDPLDSFVASGQLFGEYGAYAATPLMTATESFKDALYRRMNRFRGLMGDCSEVCVVPADACGDEVAVVVESTNPALANGKGGFWAGGFGDWSRQKGLKNIHGYDYSSGGVILGYDYVTDRLAIGFAGAYTNSSLKVDRMRTNFDSDMVNLGLYAMYNHESNLFIRGHLTYGYGWNDYEVDMVLGGKKEGDYKNQSYGAGLEVGYRAELPCDFTLVPSVGLEYTHISQDKWTETIHPQGDIPIVANRFDRQRYNSLQVPVGVRLAKVIDMGDMILIPEVRAAWVYQANDRRANIHSGYAGSGTSTTMYGVDCGPSRGVVGGGFKMVFSNCFDLAVDYTLNFRGGYRDHNLTGTLGLAF